MSSEPMEVRDATAHYAAQVEQDVPPGYKRTEVGVIPEDWEVCQVGLLANYVNGKAHEQNIKGYGKYVVVNSKFVSSEGEVRKYSDQCLCPAQVGDVLMVMSDVPNGRAIAKCFYVEEKNKYTVNQRICILTPTKIDGKLLFYKLNRNKFYLGFDDGVKQTNLRKDEVLSCPIAIPIDRKEQNAIATALSDVDALISALDKLIAKKRAIKTAAMQQLLTGKTRLPGFSGEWEVRTFGEIFDFLPTATNSRSDLSDSGDTYYIHYGDIHTRFHSHLNLSQTFPPKIDGGLCCNAALLKNGDWVMADASEDYDGVGKAIEVSGIDPGVKVVAGLHTFLLREKKPTYVSGFKGHLGNLDSLHKEYLRVATGMKVFGVSKNSLKDLQLPVPKPEEQTAIAETLSDMDAEIAALEARRDKTRAIKQGMMQELLTGRVRLVKPDDRGAA